MLKLQGGNTARGKVLQAQSWEILPELLKAIYRIVSGELDSPRDTGKSKGVHMIKSMQELIGWLLRLDNHPARGVALKYTIPYMVSSDVITGRN